MHRQRCTKHNALVHDFFVSYRVSTDKITAEKLAAHLDGKRKPDGDNFVTYLDKNCLIQGMDWEQGFTYGINNSKVLILLISQGVISTMIGKAKRGEVDNVLKEHNEALRLQDTADRIIVPVCVATLGTNKANRDVYIKLDREAALRQFDIEGESATADAQLRLQDIKKGMAKIFDMPTLVNIEPDSISEQVPKIVQIWYSSIHKAKKLSSYVTDAKKTLTDPSWFQRWFLYPSQSFRVTFIGILIGFFGVFATLALLFMHSKSRGHTDLKLGVAIGNVVAFVVLIIASMVYSAQLFYIQSQLYCTSCESIAQDSQTNSFKYLFNIPHFLKFLDDCNYECYTDETECLACVCSAVYQDCEFSYAGSLGLLMLIALLALMIIGTGVVASRFMRTESFSMSLQ